MHLFDAKASKARPVSRFGNVADRDSAGFAPSRIEGSTELCEIRLSLVLALVKYSRPDSIVISDVLVPLLLSC